MKVKVRGTISKIPYVDKKKKYRLHRVKKMFPKKHLLSSRRAFGKVSRFENDSKKIKENSLWLQDTKSTE
ncbi:hypothetical protein DLM78_17220 [Leptospira stimsonii]|uniref:Uncharacterized protein n=1 Tax=Leptospira stimsonii TaxID=2202203 RepID=A0A8B3CM90_9LEPT|nr:hypothetical protein DLM78_17220 [Leptospira stimsonii]